MLSFCQLSLSSIMAERDSPRASNTASFKTQSCSLCCRQRNGAAGKQFNVDESCVRSWRSQREKLLKTPRNKCAQRGHSAAFLELEKSLSGSPRSAKLVLACPQTSWDCLNNLRPLNAGATTSWMDLASPS